MASCGFVDVGCQVNQAIDNAVINLARAAAAGAANVAADAATFWLDVPTPDLTTGNPTVSFIQGSLYWYMGAFAVLSIMIGGIRIMAERRLSHGFDLLKSLVRLIMVNGAGLTGIAGLIYAGDGFSKWIIERSTKNFGEDLVAALSIDSAAIAIDTAIVILIIAFIAACASLVQIVLLVVRNGFLTVLAGVWPTTASFTNTEMGMAWFKRTSAWLIAYLLYKPVSAIIYATAFTTGSNAGQGANPTVDAVTALTLMIMSIIALPALQRFTAPLLSAMTGGGGGAVSGLAMALPTGAAMLRSGPTGAAMAGAGGHGSGGGPGPAGPTGAAMPGGGGGGPTGPAGPGGSGGVPRGGGPAGAGGGGGGAAGASAAGAGALIGAGMAAAQGLNNAANKSAGPTGTAP